MTAQDRLFPAAARFWLAWNEMMFHAGITIALRSSALASALWVRGGLPANECAKMMGEKQLAAIEAMAAAWMALPSGDPVGSQELFLNRIDGGLARMRGDYLGGQADNR